MCGEAHDLEADVLHLARGREVVEELADGLGLGAEVGQKRLTLSRLRLLRFQGLRDSLLKTHDRQLRLEVVHEVRVAVGLCLRGVAWRGEKGRLGSLSDRGVPG